MSAACSVDATCSWMCLQLVYEYEQRGAVAVEDQPPAPQRQHQRHSPTPDRQAELPARRPREITASSAAVVQRALEHGNLQDVPRSILSLFRRLDVGLGCTDKLPRQASKAPGLAADVAARVRRVSHGTTGCIAGTRQRAHRRRRPDRRTGGGPGRRRPARSAGSLRGRPTAKSQLGRVVPHEPLRRGTARRRRSRASSSTSRCSMTWSAIRQTFPVCCPSAASGAASTPASEVSRKRRKSTREPASGASSQGARVGTLHWHPGCSQSQSTEGLR